jgi:hypothetical protein
MKKLLAAAIVIASLSACHYGQNEAKETLERNENYKNENADFSVNRAGEYGKKGETVSASVDTTVAATADTTAKH